MLILSPGCSAQDRRPAPDSARARAPARPDDYGVYAAVIRNQFLKWERGEHGLSCEDDEPPRQLAIVGMTQPLPPSTPARDSVWGSYFPAPAVPLMAALRALDRQPGRPLEADSLALGIPVQFVREADAPRLLRTRPKPDSNTGVEPPPLIWFSRVAYTADRNWALVHAVRVCRGITKAERTAEDDSIYEWTLILPLERRGGVWIVHPALYLDVGLPKLRGN